MSISDYYRPSEEQINTIYKCDKCGREHEECSSYDVAKCVCGGNYNQVGKSYPANSDDWEEQRDPDGEWRNRRY